MSDSKRYSTLVNNTILFAISNFGSKIISLIIQPYLSYALASPDVMGVTSLMQSVANLLIPVVSLGVSFAVIRFGLDRKVDKSSVFMNGLATILLGFALMAVCWPLVRLIPNAADYLVLIYACVLMSCLRTLCTQFIRSRMLNRLVAVDGVLTSATLLGFYYPGCAGSGRERLPACHGLFGCAFGNLCFYCRALPPVFQFQKVQQSPLEGHAALLHPHDPGFHQLLDHQRFGPVLCTGHV